MSRIPNSRRRSRRSNGVNNQRRFTWLDGLELGKRDCRALLINVNEDIKETAEKRREEYLSGEYLGPQFQGYQEFRRGYVQGFKTVMSACRREERALEKSKKWQSLPGAQAEEDEEAVMFMQQFGGVW